MLCLYFTIALCITGMLPVSLGASFNPGLTRLHKREVEEDLPVPRAIADNFTSLINNLAEAAHTQGVEGKAHMDEVSKTPGEPNKRFFQVIDPLMAQASKTHRSFKENWDFASGIAIVESDEDGPLCTGVHVKPWVILTTADCVFEQQAEDTLVTIVYGKHATKHKTVHVKDIIVNPDYIEGNRENNQALVVAYVKRSWKMEIFHIPPNNFTYDDLTLAETYLHNWNKFNKRKREYVSVTTEVQVTDDEDICEELTERKAKYIREEKFCCDREGYTHTSEWYDVGSPLFYIDDDDKKYVAGLYDGDNEGEEMSGHWVWSILPNLDWLRKVIEKSSRPIGRKHVPDTTE